MKINQLFLMTLGLLTSVSVFGQGQHEHSAKCGVGLEDGALIIERLMENRRLVSAEQIAALQSQRAVKYVPVKFHIVGSSTGAGYVNVDNVFAMLCDMNNDYRSQDVQFYMKDGTVNYLNNQSIYDNATSSASSSAMINNKSSNCMNIYIGASVQSQVASFYSPWGDYIFVLNSMANGSSSTGSHEAGHFLSLPHTFYGWEGSDVRNYQPNNAPGTVVSNGFTYQVERANRTGTGANCASAADRFCDTPADYVSFRANCPYTGGVKDPNGLPVDPDETNIMSYFADACVDSFSNEQKGAVLADLVRRNWTAFPTPTPNAAVSGTGMTATAPAHNAIIELNGDVTLTWSAVTDATGYVVTLERSVFGTPVETIARKMVYGTNSTVIPASSLAYPREYVWKVKPFNSYATCGASSSSFVFKTIAPVVVGIQETFAQAAELRILSNPVTNSFADLLVNVPADLMGSIRIYGIDGKQLASQENIVFQAGDNMHRVDISTLSNGLYVVVVNTQEGTLIQKMQVQK